jgi:putative transposase
MAIEQRQPEAVLLHHSDRGAQYTSDDFRNELDKHSINCSMSARGNCYGDEAKRDVFDYIECFYNRKRRHGYLGNISPVAFEKLGGEQSQPVH